MELELNTATALLGVGIATALGATYLTRPAAPLAHPFLLGRQSIIARTRNGSESPVYASSSTGGMRAPLRPEKRLRTLEDILAESKSVFEGGVRGNWANGGDKVTDLVKALRAGLLSTLGTGEGKVAVLVEDPTDALLIILALSLTPHKPVVVAPGSKIPPNILVSAIIYSSSFASAVAPIAQHSTDARQIVIDSNSTIAEDLMAPGKELISNGEATAVPAAEPTDLALTFISGGVELPYTHLNLTAAMVSWLSLFSGAPQSTRPTINDVVLSLHHPSTPYGFGFSLFCLYTSASLNLAPIPDSAEALDVLLNAAASPSITLLVGPEPVLATSLHRHLLNKMLGDASFIIRHSRMGKLALLRKGVLSRDTFWDWLLFSGVRRDAGLRTVRAVIISGAVEQSKTDLYRLVLGAPAMSTLEHPFSLAPLAAGLMWDLQRLPPPGGGERGHVGPPTAGTEIKLSGDESEIARGRVRGEILFRSPVLPPPSTFAKDRIVVDASLPSLPPHPEAHNNIASEDSQWICSGIRAEMGTEGVLWI